MKTRSVKIIGVGGIGTYLAEPLCRYLEHSGDTIEVTVIDGDSYEEKNRNRQQFDKLENKAGATVETLRAKFPKITFSYKAKYITERNVVELIRENDLVFLCVDNHATRKLVSYRCKELNTVTLISGGNHTTDGNVIYYNRKYGKDITKAPTDLYKEIDNPTDKNPGEAKVEKQGCDTQINEKPQLLFTNLAIASCMCNIFYAHEQGKATFEQVYLDILTQRSRPAPEQF